MRTGTAAGRAIGTVATAALTFYLTVDKVGCNAQHGYADYYYYRDINGSHYSSPPFFFLLNIFIISNLPIFLKTINVVTVAITASQMNSVHHHSPTV